MKPGDKLICINNNLLDKGETYYFDHEDIWDEKYVFVKDKNNMMYWENKENFLSVKQERKLKLEKINGKG